MEKYIVYKGKGEHSVHELEKIIAQREEELHHIKSLPTSLPSDEEIHGRPIHYWKKNAEENYLETPLSVLKYITVLEIASAKIAEMERYKALVIELAEWSRKYPRDRTYSFQQKKMDDELVALEDKAKQLHP